MIRGPTNTGSDEIVGEFQSKFSWQAAGMHLSCFLSLQGTLAMAFKYQPRDA